MLWRTLAASPGFNVMEDCMATIVTIGREKRIKVGPTINND